MKKLLLLLFLCAPLLALTQSPAVLLNAHAAVGGPGFDPGLKPFYHGVASGDPLADRVIIWTRVTPDSSIAPGDSISGQWFVATDTSMFNIVSKGIFSTDSSRDFTVKVDVSGLSPATTYYYAFSVDGLNSLVGRTRTLPLGAVSRLKLAVVSCNNYEAGFFNAYARIAERHDLAAVVHLGDYIYEYEAGHSADSTINRFHQQFETVTKGQYRARYSLYHLDPDLRAAHQQHAFINIWDDHESANDSWENGAQNHQPSEGLWSDRKSAAKEAFFEWLPIRDESSRKIYRRFALGDLADLLMLDTRLEGREEQLHDVTQPTLQDTGRTILGVPQRDWFLDELSNSTATWRLIGNQVIFAPLQMGWAGQALGITPEQAESQFLDIWDGYPAERQRILSHLDSAAIDNTVFLTGDFHSSFAFDLPDTVVDENNDYAPVPNYDPATGAGSRAVEFATPSISSYNFDENFSPLAAALFELQINQPLPSSPNHNPNPHMKFVDLDRHGYVVLDIRRDSVKANWYYVPVTTTSSSQNFGGAMKVVKAQNHLRAAVESKTGPYQLLPTPVRPISGYISQQTPALELFSLYPNPAGERLFLQIGKLREDQLTIRIRNSKGSLLLEYDHTKLGRGVYEIVLPLDMLPGGVYFLELTGAESVLYRKFIKA